MPSACLLAPPARRKEIEVGLTWRGQGIMGRRRVHMSLVVSNVAEVRASPRRLATSTLPAIEPWSMAGPVPVGTAESWISTEPQPEPELTENRT